jgi:hypothetical protein
MPRKELLEHVHQAQISEDFKAEYLQLDTLEQMEQFVSYNEDKLNGTQSLLLLCRLVNQWNQLTSVKQGEPGHATASEQVRAFGGKIQRLESTLIKNCLHSKASYNLFETNLFVQAVGGSTITIDKTKSVPALSLRELEKHMLMNMNE